MEGSAACAAECYPAPGAESSGYSGGEVRHGLRRFVPGAPCHPSLSQSSPAALYLQGRRGFHCCLRALPHPAAPLSSCFAFLGASQTNQPSCFSPLGEKKITQHGNTSPAAFPHSPPAPWWEARVGWSSAKALRGGGSWKTCGAGGTLGLSTAPCSHRAPREGLGQPWVCWGRGNQPGAFAPLTLGCAVAASCPRFPPE